MSDSDVSNRSSGPAGEFIFVKTTKSVTSAQKEIFEKVRLVSFSRKIMYM